MGCFTVRTLEAPGKTRPATEEDEEYLKVLQQLCEDSLRAVEIFGEEELELWARERRRSENEKDVEGVG